MVGIVKLDRYVADTRFTRILFPVAIEIMPHKITYFCEWQNEARINCVDILV
jgi:hypothetical protein